MLQNSSSVKTINNQISIIFIDEKFIKPLFFHLAIFCLILQSLTQPIAFTVPVNFTREISFAIPSGFNFDFFKDNSLLQNNPSLSKNASPLFSPLAQSLARAGERVVKLRFTPFPVLAKNEPLARFLTPEPTTTNSATQYDQVYRIKKRRYGVRTLTRYDTQTTTQSSEIASNLNAGNIYLNSGNKLNVTGAKVNTGDLIATASGQITFRQNQSKTAGTLALINDKKIVNSINAEKNSANTQATDSSSPSSLSSSSSQGVADKLAIQPLATTNNNLQFTTSNADIVYEAGGGENVVNDLMLATNADIINHGSLIAGGNINLSATNITNSKVATVQHRSNGFDTILSGEALIKAGGSVLMKATKDINNYAGTITAGTGDITMLAGGNVNIGSIELKSRTVTSGGRKKTDLYPKI